jgi:hypothetical protein
VIDCRLRLKSLTADACVQRGRSMCMFWEASTSQLKSKHPVSAHVPTPAAGTSCPHIMSKMIHCFCRPAHLISQERSDFHLLTFKVMIY